MSVQKSKYKFQNRPFPKSKSKYRSGFRPQLRLSSKCDVLRRKKIIILRLREFTGISLSRLKLMSVTVGAVILDGLVFFYKVVVVMAPALVYT